MGIFSFLSGKNFLTEVQLTDSQKKSKFWQNALKAKSEYKIFDELEKAYIHEGDIKAIDCCIKYYGPQYIGEKPYKIFHPEKHFSEAKVRSIAEYAAKNGKSKEGKIKYALLYESLSGKTTFNRYERYKDKKLTPEELLVLFGYKEYYDDVFRKLNKHNINSEKEALLFPRYYYESSKNYYFSNNSNSEVPAAATALLISVQNPNTLDVLIDFGKELKIHRNAVYHSEEKSLYAAKELQYIAESQYNIVCSEIDNLMRKTSFDNYDQKGKAEAISTDISYKASGIADEMTDNVKKVALNYRYINLVKMEYLEKHGYAISDFVFNKDVEPLFKKDLKKCIKESKIEPKDLFGAQVVDYMNFDFDNLKALEKLNTFEENYLAVNFGYQKPLDEETKKLIEDLGKKYVEKHKKEYDDMVHELYKLDSDGNLINIYDSANEAFEKKDYKKAAQCYKVAAYFGLIPAMNDYAYCLINGLGIEQDLKLAETVLLKTAKQNDDEAQYNLGTLYEREDFKNYDIEKSKIYYLRAAFNGSTDALYKLGKFNEEGKGFEKNTEKALYWYKKCAEAGNENANEAVRRLEGEQK